MQVTYEALLTRYDDASCTIELPDWGVTTEGSSLKDALEMGVDLLRTEVTYALANNRPLPEPHFDHRRSDNEERVILSVDVTSESAKQEWPWISTSEAAELLGVTIGRIHQLINAGTLRSTKEGRDMFVLRSDVERRLASSPQAGRPKKLSAA